MSAPLAAGTPIDLLKKLGDAKRREEEGEDSALMRCCDALEDVELARAVLMAHDMMRSLGSHQSPAIENTLRVQTDLLVAVFMRFAEEPFLEAMREHLEWWQDANALEEEWADA